MSSIAFSIAALIITQKAFSFPLSQLGNAVLHSCVSQRKKKSS